MDSSDDSDGSDSTDYTLIFKAANFLKKDLDGLISRFVEKNSERYSKDDGNIENKEHSLNDTVLHKEFVDEFESMLERYIEEECPKMSKMAALQLFFEGARDTMEGRFQPLFMEEEDPNREFVESLLAVSDYEVFFKMLTDASKRNSGGQKMNSSEGNSHGGEKMVDDNDDDNNAGDRNAGQKRK
jgi:hypothetical protein